MTLRRCPAGVTVSTLSRHVRGLGFDSRGSTPFSIYFVLFALCLPLFLDC